MASVRIMSVFVIQDNYWIGWDTILKLWRITMINALKIWMSKLIPSIHNLPQVIYIRWIDRDWYIRK